MALFGAIVMVGLGPALWLGAQFAEAGPLPAVRSPISAEHGDGGGVPTGEILPERTVGAKDDTSPQKPRYLPAGPPVRDKTGTAARATLAPSPSRSAAASPSASARPSATASVDPTPSTAPSTPTAAPDATASAPTTPLERTGTPGGDSVPTTTAATSPPAAVAPFEKSGSPEAVLARR